MTPFAEALVRQRLHAAVLAVCPIKSVSAPTFGSSVGARIDFDVAATPAQQTAAQSALNAFDWSQGAQDTFDNLQARTDAQANLTASLAQFKLLRAVAAVLVDELNIVRAALPHPVLSITRVTTVGTVTTYDPHGLTTGDQVRITGATLAAYNVLATVTVTSATVFTYAVAGSPATPAVGSISFTQGALPLLQPRTLAQAKTAIINKINTGLVDT